YAPENVPSSTFLWGQFDFFMEPYSTRGGPPVKCVGMATALVKSPSIDPRFTCYRMVIRESAIHGRGVYALERIPKGRKVVEYTGEKISRRETKRRGQGSITYLFTLDNYWTIDGAVGGSGAEIINHSCEPNLYTWILRGHILY